MDRWTHSFPSRVSKTVSDLFDGQIGDLSDFGVIDVTGLGITLLTHNSMQQLAFRALSAIEQLPA